MGDNWRHGRRSGDNRAVRRLSSRIRAGCTRVRAVRESTAWISSVLCHFRHPGRHRRSLYRGGFDHGISGLPLGSVWLWNDRLIACRRFQHTCGRLLPANIRMGIGNVSAQNMDVSINVADIITQHV